MKTILPLLILMNIFILACDSDDEMAICSAAQEDLIVEQLKNTFESCSCDPAVIKGTFMGNTVYYTRILGPACDSVFDPTIYSCSGEVIDFSLLKDPDFYYEHVKFVEVLYRCGE